MANPTSYLDASKSTIHNMHVTIASNVKACAFSSSYFQAFNQRPISYRTALIIDTTVLTIGKLAPYAIAMVGTYYAPARVTFLAVGFAAFLANNKFIKEKRVGRIVGGVALGILLGKSVVATVVTIALLGTAAYYLSTQRDRHSAERNKINQKLLEDEKECNNKPKVEDVTDEVSVTEVSIDEAGSVDDSSVKERNLPKFHINDSDTEDESSVEQRKLPKLHLYSSDKEDEVAAVSSSEESSTEYNTQKEI